MCPRAALQRLQRPGFLNDDPLEGGSRPSLTGLKSLLCEWVPEAPLNSPFVTLLSVILRNIFCFINKINDEGDDYCSPLLNMFHSAWHVARILSTMTFAP